MAQQGGGFWEKNTAKQGVDILVARARYEAYFCTIVAADIFVLEAGHPLAVVVGQVGCYRLIVGLHTRAERLEVHGFACPKIIGRQ